MRDIDLNGCEELTIGQMCKAFDVTPRTLRFYESKGLLSPRREGQRRLYTQRERGRLALILRGKRFGFSLSKIRELLELYDPENDPTPQVQATISAARQRLIEMTAQRDELTEAIGELEDSIARAEAMLRERKS